MGYDIKNASDPNNENEEMAVDHAIPIHYKPFSDA